ncbi:MAG: hypothetical protein A2005_02880 [Desulfuromonadales bacterium GWC2_61_20]|nr:MAG: hypothetical protein A2005_02880 [Desulfuromonadales bacterium GWC2_61_20]
MIAVESNLCQTMNRYLVKNIFLFLCQIAIICAPFTVTAQEDEYDEYVPQPSVYWHVSMDEQGNTTSNLTVRTAKDGSDLAGARQELVTALQEALQCTFDDDRAEPDKNGVQINSECKVPVRKDGLVNSVVIDPAPIRKLLAAHGQFKFDLSITLPKLGFSSVGRDGRAFSHGAQTTHSLTFEPEEQNTDKLPLEFGYRKSYVVALCATSLCLLIAPIVLILIIRRRSLILAGKDAAAAWFGYWRVHRWVAEGVWVVWIIAISVFSVETFIGYLTGSNQPILNALVLFLPPGIVSFLCQYLARPLWLHVRGVAWDRREMLVKGFWEHAAAILPMVFLIIGIGSLVQNAGTAMLWFAGAGIAKLVGAWMHGKISQATPRPLHSGELREKILEMARRAGVKIQQVYLLPAKRLQMGNAFAMQGGRVMITDYLLERLTQQETDCVMAHEIGHVKMRHTVLLSWVGMLLLFALFNVLLWGAFMIAPSLLSLLWADDFERLLVVQEWLNEYLHFPLAFLLALLSRYYLSRRFERSADEFATLVTGAPEAMITALVKLSKMNLMPITWGSWDERLSTHPATLRRAKAIAERHQIPAERLRILLDMPATRGEEDGYAVPDEAASTDLVYSTEFKLQKTLAIMLLLMLTVSMTPVVWVRFVSTGGFSAAALWAGFVLVPLVYLAVANYASLLGYGKMKRGMREKTARAGFNMDDARSYFVGLSPEEHPRAYENHTVWDIGFLNITSDALVYSGDRVGFRIPREQVTSITQGLSFPSWFDITETYVRWTEEGRERILHFHSLDGHAMTAIAKRSKSLLLDLMSWKDGRLSGRTATAAENALGRPLLPDVQGSHPRHALTLKGFLTSVAFVALLIFGLAGLFSLESSLTWYGFGMGAWTLLVANMPSMRYKEMPAAGAKVPVKRSRELTSDRVEVSCPTCAFSRSVPRRNLPAKPVRATCPKCGDSFSFDRHVEMPAEPA